MIAKSTDNRPDDIPVDEALARVYWIVTATMLSVGALVFGFFFWVFLPVGLAMAGYGMVRDRQRAFLGLVVAGGQLSWLLGFEMRMNSPLDLKIVRFVAVTSLVSLFGIAIGKRIAKRDHRAKRSR